MIKETKNNGHPEEGIHELFAYLPKLGVYRNSSDMNELVYIAKYLSSNVRRNIP